MIEARDLTMHYGATLALDRASFKVAGGEIMGLLGPNGAGKTTAMNILATHLIPTGGTAAIGAHDIHEEPLEARRLLGYLPEVAPLYADMEVAEYLRFVGRSRGLPAGRLKERTEWVIEACGLATEYRKLTRTLSRGFRQRVGLAQALLHDPEVLILDEPTTGLDPLQIVGIRKLIRELARTKTVIFSTHIMQEASAVTDRVVIINEGRIIADTSLSELTGTLMETQTTVSVRAGAAEVRALLESTGGVGDVKPLGGSDGYERFEFRAVRPSRVTEALADAFLERGWAVREFSERVPTLEEAFIALIQKSRKAGAGAKPQTPSPAGEVTS